MEPVGACAWHWPLSLAARWPPSSSASGPSAHPRAVRRVTAVTARVRFADGSQRDLDGAELLAPIERTLRSLACAAALAMVLAR